MKVPIKLFECLDEVAKRHNIKTLEWANAANIRRGDIYDLRNLSENPHEDIGRACTVEKINKLVSGLKLLVGGNVTKNELRHCIEKEMDDSNTDMLIQMMGQFISDFGDTEAKDKAKKDLIYIFKNIQ
jgi:hypothetical protein